MLTHALLVLATLFPPTPVEPDFDHSHAAFTAVLGEHVDASGVHYAALKKDPARLESYLVQLHTVTPEQLEGWSREQRFAFWINVYNAHTLWLVVDRYPVKSIKSIGSFFNKVWDKRFIDMPTFDPDGRKQKLTLNEVEHEILRVRFQDARVHAAVNCASVSCPALRAEAFVAERLEEQIDEQVRAWLGDESRNRFDLAKKEARVSEIFKWFADDFIKEEGSVVAWIAKHAPEEISERLASAQDVKLRYLDYSWKLNEAK